LRHQQRNTLPESEMSEKRNIFLLGLGAQKTGTTWMHRYLCTHPHADFGRMKEYHIWDGVHVPELAEFRIDKLPAFEHIRHAFSRGSKPRIRYKMQQDPNWYGAYFEKIANRPGIRITGDITPSYAALPASSLTGIREILEPRGFAVKPVFIMRDPFERCWSALRMANRQRRKRGEVITLDKEFAELRATYKSAGTQARTRYDLTIKNLLQAFDQKDTHICLFEEFFTPASARRLTDFLEISPLAPDFEKKVNATRKSTGSLPEDLVAEVVDFYRPAYDAAIDLFGERKIRQLWKNASLL
jgi:hypothetical protein